jgi:pyrroline-5-carboxylate reductase
MARALAGGLVRARLVDSARIVAVDPSEAACRQFSEQLGGGRFVSDTTSLIDAAEVIVLAVKPQQVEAVVAQTADGCPAEKLLVSIVAGVGLSRLCAGFRTERVIRVMPNTPCLVGCGASGYALGPGAAPEDGALVGRLMDSVGISYQVDEYLLDAVTGLSGSGPAFVYTVIESLSDGGVRMGLPRGVATRLAAQTVLGAARMVLDSGEHPAVLRDQVTSPGGTTIAGIHALEDHGLRAALIGAVQAAAVRSHELAGKNGRG